MVITEGMYSLKLLVVSWTLLAIVNLVASSDRDDCRCLASDDCWPTSKTWDAFNITVGGRLIAPKPTGYPCHDPHFNAAMCQIVQANSSNPHWREANPGSMQWNNWEQEGKQKCEFQAPESSPCQQGRVSVLGVQVEMVDDVQKAVKFASKHNLHVVVKSTGHDFSGRSAAAGSFLIWMHKLKTISIIDSFTAVGNNSGQATVPAITIAGGVVWGEVYDALKDTGYVIVGGIGLTICATGGYVQGGGHGILGPSFGLGVDNVLQIEVVTADGTLHTVNACQDPELFFALRGGGGGTFGVVTSVTYKIHKNPTNLVGPTIILSPPNGTSWTPETQEAILTVFFNHTIALDAAHWGGYWTFGSTGFNGYFLAPGSEAAVNETSTPVMTALSQIEHVAASISMTDWKEDWHSALSLLSVQTGQTQTGENFLLGSRLVPYMALKDSRGLARTVLSAMVAANLTIVGSAMVIGPGVRGADPDGLTSVTPAWRTGIFEMYVATVWPWNGTEADAQTARKSALSFTKSLHKAFPNSGAYINEASIDEPDWIQSFWGKTNYAKLMATKSRVDPSGLFVCLKCVGSEQWKKGGNCRTKLR